MSTNVPEWELKLLAVLADAQGNGLTVWYLGATLTISGLPSASASGAARRALDRLCRLGLVSPEGTTPVKLYRITLAGLNSLADRS